MNVHPLAGPHPNPAVLIWRLRDRLSIALITKSNNKPNGVRSIPELADPVVLWLYTLDQVLTRRPDTPINFP